MDKVGKQIGVNVLLILFSCIVIFIVKSVDLGRFAQLKECVGSDIVFTMITSLVTTVTWRYFEQVEGKYLFLYNIVVAFVMILFAILYGMSIVVDENEVVINFTYISFGLFMAVYIIENVLIINHFKNIHERSVITFDFGYNKED
jgi:hypothetical protein